MGLLKDTQNSDIEGLAVGSKMPKSPEI